MVMHTGDDLTDTEWLLDDNNRLIPASWCDTEYLEQAFENESAFFMRAIGSQNSAEMHQKLVENPRERLPDSEFYKHVNSLSDKWFHSGLSTVPAESKLRLVPYVYRTMRTSIPQLARAFGLDRDKVAAAIGRKNTR